MKARSNESDRPFSGNDKVRIKLEIIKKITSIYAILRLILFDARGRFFVLKTLLSISLSQMSFAIHPKPLTNNPPAKIFKTRDKLGLTEGVSHKLHPAGINRINLPDGLFHLKSSKIAYIFFFKKGIFIS